MELDQFTAPVQDQLIAAAALGDERTRQIAEALSGTAGSAVRMAILDALAAACTELTDALFEAAGPAAAVTLQLDGEQVRFAVTAAPAAEPEPVQDRPEDREASARISLRLSESLKAEVELAAGRAEISINSWLVRAAGSALRAPAGGDWLAESGRRGSAGSRHITGWVTG